MIAEERGIALPLQPSTRLLQSADCLTEDWWELARGFPIAAMRSVLFPLLTLESPERWQQLEADNLDQWVDHGWNYLSPRDQRLLSADCCAHVLPFFEGDCPGEQAPARSIALFRQWALYPADEALLADLNMAHEASWRARDKTTTEAALAVAQCCALFPDTSMITHCAVAYAYSVINDYTDVDWMVARLVERRWQWRRLLGYLAEAS